VVMPFVDELTPVYNAIRSITQNLGLMSKRGDDVFMNDSIANQAWNAIFNARLCIAECTGRDPNVFYEMGIAHTLGRPCILISQSVTDIPFDVRHRRVITYDATPDGIIKFKDILTKTIRDELG